MPKLAPYDSDLTYGYTPGVFPSHALLEARPGIARRLLVHSQACESEGVLRLIERCESLGVRVETADQALSRISRKENCYAAIVFDKYADTLSPDAPHVVLCQPSDMGNIGTVLRACLGFGLTDLAIIRPAADLFDPRVIRASMGALFAVRLRVFDTFSQYRSAYPLHVLYPFMLTGAVSLREATAMAHAPYALVFGNEGEGLPADFATLGTAVRIPHSDKIDSLNLAVAVSIAAYAFAQGNGAE